jgi:hypothetical protein
MGRMGIGIGEKQSALSLAPIGGSDVGKRSIAYAVWGLVRLPVLLIAIALFREPIFVFLANFYVLIDPAKVTMRVIDLIGTPLARAALFFASAAAVMLICWAARRIFGARAFLPSLAGILVLTMAMLVWSATSFKFAPPLMLLAATNLLPDRLFARFAGTPASRDRFMAFAVGIAEVLMLRRYLEWVGGLLLRRPVTLGDGLPGILPTALVLGLAMMAALRSEVLIPIEQALRMPAEARIIAKGNYNGIEMDVEGRYLLATGHGIPQLLRYDLGDTAAPPFRSPVDNSGAQGFAYDPAAREIYVLDAKRRELLFLDAATLDRKRAIAVPDLSDGDSWLSVNAPTNTITLVSEADSGTGVPFLVIDRSTGAVRDKRDLDAGNVLERPGSPYLYLSFFRRRNSIMIYDLATLSIKAEALAPSQVDRMLYDAERNEVLLTVPLRSRITRFDADTLKPVGEIRSQFGVRVLAIDRGRQLLLTASLVTGEVAVLDFRSGEELARFYLGPWLRSIQADPARGKAYVSSNGALYELNYGHLR